MSKTEFLAMVKKGAIEGWKKNKILPSLTGAQAVLESGWGSSDLSKKANNYFGIKASDDWKGATVSHMTKEFVDGKWIEVSQLFRKYSEPEESITDHTNFFVSTAWRKDNYKHVFGETDYKKAVQAILTPKAVNGYATDPDYANKIISIIEENKLYDWDKEATGTTGTTTGKDDVIVANGKIVVIDAGHGGSDGGTSGNGLTEKTWVLDVSKLTQKYLQELGYTVYMTRSTDVFVGLSERAVFANNKRADIFISQHFNGFGDASAKGYEDFIYSGVLASDGVTPNLQNKIHAKVSAVTSAHGIVNRGKKRADYAVIRETNMPAILLEAGFCTNPTDASAMIKSTFKDSYARAVAQGVNDFFGGKGTIGTTPPAEVVKPDSVSGNNYVMKKGDTLYSVAKANGVTVQQLLAWNPSITNPNSIPVGTRLTVKNGTSTYTIKSGDTLTSIAGRFGMTVPALVALNGMNVNDILQVGRVLNVSGSEVGSAGNGGVSTSPNIVRYTVKSGDNLSTIAQTYGTTTQAIANANGISNPNLIPVGKELVINASGAPAQADRFYTVKSGDSLSVIAENLGVPMATLVSKNGIKNPNEIAVGQKLKY